MLTLESKELSKEGLVGQVEEKSKKRQERTVGEKRKKKRGTTECAVTLHTQEKILKDICEEHFVTN